MSRKERRGREEKKEKRREKRRDEKNKVLILFVQDDKSLVDNADGAEVPAAEGEKAAGDEDYLETGRERDDKE